MMEPEEFLMLVAGELCPCGHDKGDHAPPVGDVAGLPEVMGSCVLCSCEGIVSATDE